MTRAVAFALIVLAAAMLLALWFASPAVTFSGNAPLSGYATWYRFHPGQAAAGPALRQGLGPDWRGSLVEVCSSACVTVRLTDWCACGGGRVVDLDRSDFARLAPPSVGIVAVTVRQPQGVPLAPATDTEGGKP